MHTILLKFVGALGYLYSGHRWTRRLQISPSDLLIAMGMSVFAAMSFCKGRGSLTAMVSNKKQKILRAKVEGIFSLLKYMAQFSTGEIQGFGKDSA